MLLYEVTDVVREGCRITLLPGAIGVSMGNDVATGTPTIIPVDDSIGKWLGHPDDRGLQFTLMRAALVEMSAELHLAAQTAEEAMAEGKALVHLTRSCDALTGTTKVAAARGNYSMPTLLAAVQNNGTICELYEFSKGDGLFISIPAAALDADRPKRFKLLWDGVALREELAQKVPRRRQAYLKAPEAEPTSPPVVQRSHLRELRA